MSGTTTILWPRVSMPLAMIGFSVFLAFLVSVVVRLGAVRDVWWVLLVLLVLSIGALLVGCQSFLLRRQRTLDIGAEAFIVNGVRVPRESIAMVKRHVDLRFKGVRVVLTTGTPYCCQYISIIPAAPSASFGDTAILVASEVLGRRTARRYDNAR